MAEAARIALVPFDPPNEAPDDVWDGLVGIAPLNVPQLVYAYGQGAFPWFWYAGEERGPGAAYFIPPKRGVLFLDRVHVQRSLARFERTSGYTVTFDNASDHVVFACASAPRVNKKGVDEGTWISPQFVAAWRELFRAGVAHSVEVWDENYELVGGLYGTFVKGVFAGDSAFSTKDNASKLALLHLVRRLQANGHRWMDVQTVTELTGGFGAVEIEREEHQRLLAEAQKENRPF